jgi:arylsulfatase A-like enzyme
MRFEYRGVVTDRYTYVRTIDRPWLLYDNRDDPYQLTNLIDDPKHATTRDRLDGLMRAHMRHIGDGFHPRQDYYKRFGITLDHRGKVVDLVENLYDRNG